MHSEIFTRNQQELLPFLGAFRRSFYLVGGTAIALHLGHRRSVDFDLFTASKLNKKTVWEKLSKIPFPKIPVFEDVDQLHLVIHGVKFTFLYYPYQVMHPVDFKPVISVPTLLSLAAMKAFALGRRSKWKDYVDLWFMLKHHFSVDEISKEANILFPGQFSEKLFRGQLSFHKDIDFSEPVEFMGTPVPEEEIKSFLIEQAIGFMGK